MLRLTECLQRPTEHMHRFTKHLQRLAARLRRPTKLVQRLAISLRRRAIRMRRVVEHEFAVTGIRLRFYKFPQAAIDSLPVPPNLPALFATSKAIFL
jgi:hypothetical protein